MQEPCIRDDGLQLEEHPRLQRRFWLLERAAWATFVVILLLALVGLTGAGGYLSQRTVALAGGQLQIPRVARWEASDELRVRFDAGTDRHRLTLGPRFYEYFEVEGVRPQPDRTTTSQDGTTMEFPAPNQAPTLVVLYVRPLTPGFSHHSVHLNSAKAEVPILILP